MHTVGSSATRNKVYFVIFDSSSRQHRFTISSTHSALCAALILHNQRHMFNSLSLSLPVLMATFPRKPGLAGFIGAKNNGSGGDNWSHKTAKLQSNHHHQQINTQLFMTRCPSCCPTNSVRALKGNHYCNY